MARMVRKQVYIEPEHDALLKRKARELGVTESDLIRRGIEQIARTASPVPRDARAWDEELAFMRQRGRLRIPAGKRTWTREELYDERLQRISGRH